MARYLCILFGHRWPMPRPGLPYVKCRRKGCDLTLWLREARR